MDTALQDLLALAVAMAHVMYLPAVPSLAIPGLVRVWSIVTNDHVLVTQFSTLQLLIHLHEMLGDKPWPIQHVMSMLMFAGDESFLDVIIFWYAILIASLTPSFIFYFMYFSLMAIFHRVRALRLLAQVCELALVVTMYDEVAGLAK